MEEERFSLGKERYDAIKKYAKENKTTPFLVISTLYGVLIYRYFGQKDMSIGYPVNIRPKGFSDALGDYVSIYPLRIQINQQDNFKNLLARTSTEQKEDRKNLYLGVDDIIESLGRNVSKKDFNIVCGMTMLCDSSLSMKNTEIEVEISSGMEKRDLDLLFDLATESLECKLSYNRNLFMKRSASRLISNYCNLVDKIILDRTEEKVINIDFLIDEVKQKLLIEYNNTQTKYSQNKTIHQLFEDQVKKTPNNIAAVFEGQKITYNELN